MFNLGDVVRIRKGASYEEYNKYGPFVIKSWVLSIAVCGPTNPRIEELIGDLWFVASNLEFAERAKTKLTPEEIQ